MTNLTKTRGFTTLIAMMFLNAFIDLGHKIIIQNTLFKLYDGPTQVVLTAIVNALILLPFIALFTPAGFISDRYPKHQVMRVSAIVTLASTATIAVCYWAGWFWAAFAMTVILAIQSAFYSPAKFGYLRRLLSSENLARGNAVAQAATIIAILLGTFVFSLIFELRLNQQSWQDADQVVALMVPAGLILVALALVEVVLAWRLPQADSGQAIRFDRHQYLRGQALKNNIKLVRSHSVIWLSILGLSLFWATGQVLLASFPAFAKSSLAQTNTLLIQGALACSGIGIALGSMVASRVSGKHIDVGLIPTGGIGVAIALVCLPNMNSLTAMGACLLVMGTAAGLLLVPLRTLIQYHAPAESLGTILAGSNWVQNIAMASFLFASMALSLAGLPPEYLLWLLAGVAVSGSIWAVRLLPHSLTRFLVMTLLRSRYRVQVEGFEHLPPSGPALLLGNHISWIDWAIVQIACPRPVRFVMIKYIYNHPVLKPILKFFKVIPIAPGDADQALAEVNRALANGEVVCIFPEGAISRNGHLGSFRRGYERAVEGVEGCIVPFYLHGLWGSRFSRASFFQQQGSIGKRDLVVGFGAPMPLSTQAPELKQKVAELSVDTWGKHIDAMHSLGSVYLRRAKQMLARTLCVDTDGEQYTHRQVISKMLAFSQTLAKSQLADNAAVGIALPAGIASLVANLAVISRGYIAVNLDPAMQSQAQQQSAKRSDLALVITSADLVEQWRNVATCIAIDSLLDSSSTAKRLSYALIAQLVPAPLIARIYFGNAGVDAPAAIQFDHEHSDLTDENPPRAAILTHRNLLASIKQTACVLDAQADDALVACTPAWHRFGLTAHLLMPAIEGFPVVFTDTNDPLAIAKDAALQNATLLCLDVKQIDALAKNERIHPLMLASCRLVLCNDQTATAEQIQAFKDKFTTEVYTSFGAAENAFAVCANIPDRLDTSAWKTQVGNKLGTVGLPLPGTSCRILNPDDLMPLSNGEVGEVVISGNQVMDGYLDQPEETAEKFILWQYRRWLRTGIRGQLDDDGFLTLVVS